MVMDKGLKNDSIDGKSKNWEITGNSWRQAQEIKKAIPAMETAAGKSDSGELYARLGNIYLDGDQFNKAATAINKGLKRGGVKRPDTARLVLGMAYYNVGKYQQAEEAFEAAGRDERSKQYADQWINYMNKELERQKSMQEEETALEASTKKLKDEEPAQEEGTAEEGVQEETVQEG
jgi:tetratricopeptide (TPR) repeat protein